MQIAFRALLPRGIFTQQSPTTALETVTLGGETFLVASDSFTNGVSLYRITASGGVQLVDQQTHARGTGAFSGVDILHSSAGGADRLLVALNGLDGLQRHNVTGTGLPGSAEQVSFGGQAAVGAHTLAALGDRVYVGHETGGISVYQSNANGSLSFVQNVGTGLAHVDALVTLTRGGTGYLVSASASGDDITLWEITGDGRLRLADVVGPEEGLPAVTPTALASAVVDGRSYVIVGAAGTSSLSVLEVRGNGTLALTDHVIDDLSTRFGRVAEIAVAEWNGQIFVAAGGPDDGITLFVLAPGGLLVPLATVADSTATPLANVTALALAGYDGGLALFAASESEQGIARYEIALGDHGIVAGDTAANDRHAGTAADDILIAGEGADTLTGGAGDDRFVMLPGAGTDRITDYGNGADVIDLSWIPLVHSMDQVTVAPLANGARVTVRGQTFDVISAAGRTLDADAITFGFGPGHYVFPLSDGGGSGGGDTGGGDTGGGDTGGGDTGGGDTGGGDTGGGGGSRDGDTIMGTEGRDVLQGGPRADVIHGLGGNDILMAGEGGDMLDGGDGNDTADYSGVPGRVLIDLQVDVRAAGFARFFQYGDVSGDEFVSIERFVGGDYADNLRGGEGDDRLVGGGVSDRLYGRAGDDRLEGGTGADALYGNRGADVLIGGPDAGRRDRFIYFNAEESPPGEGQRDQILDFVPGEDRIEISRIDADIHTARKQTFDFIGQAAFSGQAGELRAAWNAGAGMTLVQADTDGDGIADFEIALWGNLTLSAEDFLL